LERFREALKDKDIYYLEDIVSMRSYKQYAVTDSDFLKNILIWKGTEIESLGNVSSILTAPAKRSARIYFRDESARRVALEIYMKC
jgi:hypothetical protein